MRFKYKTPRRDLLDVYRQNKNKEVDQDDETMTNLASTIENPLSTMKLPKFNAGLRNSNQHQNPYSMASGIANNKARNSLLTRLSLMNSPFGQ
jgi:hypothetical protein